MDDEALGRIEGGIAICTKGVGGWAERNIRDEQPIRLAWIEWIGSCDGFLDIFPAVSIRIIQGIEARREELAVVVKFLPNITAVLLLVSIRAVQTGEARMQMPLIAANETLRSQTARTKRSAAIQRHVRRMRQRWSIRWVGLSIDVKGKGSSFMGLFFFVWWWWGFRCASS